MEERVEIPVGRSSVSAKVVVQPSPVVVIATHPWGPMGGCMDDIHPVTVCKLMARAGCSTARFDFRSGIGSGASSIADLEAVAAWFTETRDTAPIASQVLIVGYSYGSVIGAAAAASIPRTVGFAAIGPPLDYGWALYPFNAGSLRAKAAACESLPKLVMVGTDDQFCSVSSFRQFVDSLSEPKSSVLLEGVDHFSLYQHLPQALADWVTQAFGVTDLRDFGRGVPTRRQ